MASEGPKTSETECETGEANSFALFLTHYQRIELHGEGVKAKSEKTTLGYFLGQNRSGEGLEPVPDLSIVNGYETEKDATAVPQHYSRITQTTI